jgi:hypothetical protein
MALLAIAVLAVIVFLKGITLALTSYYLLDT